MRNVVVAVVAAMLLACGTYGQKTVPAAQKCERLAQVELPGAKIGSAQTIAAGAFPPPPNATPWMEGSADVYKTLAGWWRKRSRAPTRPSRSKCGCPSKDGTENCRARAMEDLPERSATLDWGSRCSKDMRQWARTRVIRQAGRTQAGRWDIRRKWPIMGTAESMR